VARQRTTTERDNVSAESSELVQEPVAEVTVLPMSVTTHILGDNMKVAVSRSFKINMGNYESADSFVSVTVDVPVATDLVALSDEFGAVLDTLQGPDMRMFRALTRENKSIAKSLDFE
jgi:hypothetical protein